MNWLTQLFQRPQMPQAGNMLAQAAQVPAMQGQPQVGMPANPAQGQVVAGPDGKRYQFAETTGMAGANGTGNGWIETTLPANNGFMQRLQNFGNSERGQILGDTFAGWAMGGTPGESLGYGALMARQGRGDRQTQQRQQQQANQTQEWLRSQGLDDQTVGILSSNPELLQQYMKETMLPEDQDPFTLGAGQVRYDAQGNIIAQGPSPAESGTAERGLSPIYGTDAQGNPVLLQLGKDGTAIQTAIPEGVEISTGVDRIDLGTNWGLLDKRSGQMVGTVPKDIAGAEAQKAIGTAQGEAQADLPATLAQAESMLTVIQDVKNDPNRELGTGASSVFNRIPATPGYDYNQKVQQLQGQAFLQAFESLKGGGQITEVEGLKAEQAIARLSTAQSEAAFLQALNDLESVVQLGIQRAQTRAGQGGGNAQPQPNAAAPAPQVQRFRFNPQTGELE